MSLNDIPASRVPEEQIIAVRALERPVRATVKYNQDCPGVDVALDFPGNRYLALHLKKGLDGSYEASCLENLLKICIEGTEY